MQGRKQASIRYTQFIDDIVRLPDEKILQKNNSLNVFFNRDNAVLRLAFAMQGTVLEGANQHQMELFHQLRATADDLIKQVLVLQVLQAHVNDADTRAHTENQHSTRMHTVVFRDFFSAAESEAAEPESDVFPYFPNLAVDLGEELSPAFKQLVNDLTTKRYPAPGKKQKSPVMQLKNRSQVLLFLKVDALLQLNERLEQERVSDLSAHQALITAIQAMPEIQAHKDFLIQNAIPQEQHTHTVSQFLKDLPKRSLTFKVAIPAPAALPTRANSTDNVTSMHVAADPNEEALENVQQPETQAPQASANSRSPYAMPAYLAQSFMNHFATAIDEVAATMTITGADVVAEGKAVAMRAAATALRSADTAALQTLGEMYELGEFKSASNAVEDTTVKAVLSRKRGREEASSITSTLTKAGITFLAENPVSLMRRYVFLTQLGAVMHFPQPQHQKDYQQYLDGTIAAMRILRKAMKKLYPINNDPANPSVITSYVSVLMELSKKDPDIAPLVHVLLVACLDQLDERALQALPYATKLWLLDPNSSARSPQQIPRSKSDFIQAVADNLWNKGAAVIKRPYSIQNCVFSLLEITSFQQGRYRTTWDNSPYPLSEHQAKMQQAAIHLGACVDHYFVEPARREEPTANKKPASVIDLKLCADGTIVPQEMEIAVEDGADFSQHRTTLRLVSNLPPVWQAVLASNAKAGSIAAVTLALVNNQDQQALMSWEYALNEVPVNSSAEVQAHMYAWIMDSFCSAEKKGEGYAQQAIDAISKYPDFSKREASYRAIIQFAEILQQHVALDQAKSDIQNQSVATLCLIVSDYMEGVRRALLNETVLIQRETADLRRAGPRQRSKVSPNLSGLQEQGVTEAGTLLKLEERIEQFQDKLKNTCFPISRDQSGDPIDDEGKVVYFENDAASLSVSGGIEAIREGVYGPLATIINPNAGPAFKVAFKSALARNDDAFLIDALFTLSHYSLQSAKGCALKPNENHEEYAADLCGLIGKHQFVAPHGNLHTLWAALHPTFYGNSSALVQLLEHYLPIRTPVNANTLLDTAAIEKALKIAMFGFQHKRFEADKLLFARKIVLAFAALARLQPPASVAARANADAARLDDAFEVLLDSSAIMSAEEQTALATLKPVMDKWFDLNRSTSAVENYDSLHLRAERHAVICSKSHAATRTATLLGLLIGAQQVVASSVARPVTGIPVRAEVRTPKVVQQELDFYLTKLLDGAFPVVHPDPDTPGELRYFLTGHRSDTNKLDREALKKLLWKKIDIRRQSRLDAHIDSWVLQAAINDLYKEVDATFKNETQTAQWIQNKLKTGVAKNSVLEPQVAKKVFFENQSLAQVAQEVAAGLDLLRAEQDASHHANGCEETANSVPLEHPESAPSKDASNTLLTYALESEIERAVFEVEEWLLSAEQAPTLQNIPFIVGKLIDTASLDQGKIDGFRDRLKAAGHTDYFRRRLALLRDGRGDLCFEHVKKHLTPNVRLSPFECVIWKKKGASPTSSERDNLKLGTLFVQKNVDQSTTAYWKDENEELCEHTVERALSLPSNKISNLDPSEVDRIAVFFGFPLMEAVDAEFNAFIEKLKSDAPSYLDHFIWSTVEAVYAPRPNGSGNAEGDPDYIQLLKDQGYDWPYLVAIGCQRYAHMNPQDHVYSHKGSRLLTALLVLAKPLVAVKTFGPDQAQPSSPLSDVESRSSSSEDGSPLLPQDARLSIESLLRDLLEHTEHDEQKAHQYIAYYLRGGLKRLDYSVKELLENHFINDQSRRFYTAFLLENELNDLNLQSDDSGTKVYDLIYTLAQALRLEKVLAQADSGHTVDQVAAAPAARDVSDIDEEVDQLLKYLHEKLLNDSVFSKWHQGILKPGHDEGVISSLDVLIRHRPYPAIRSLLENPRNRTSTYVLNTIASTPYYWERAYGSQAVYRERFSYEAHTVCELTKLMSLEVFETIEQLAFALMIAKRYEEDTPALFKQAVDLMAEASDQDATDIVQSLLVKACHSFNRMLNPGIDEAAKEADKKARIALHEEQYALTTPKNALLKHEIMEWIKSSLKIAEIYVACTLEAGVQCREQADFVFELLQGAADSHHDGNLPLRRSSIASSVSESSHQPARQAEHTVYSNAQDRYKLLYQAFAWKYEYIDRGRSKQQLFNQHQVRDRLVAFFVQVDKYHLWQEYYAYMATVLSTYPTGMATFANAADVKNASYFKLHADNMICVVRLHSPQEDDVFMALLQHMFTSWCQANLDTKQQVYFYDEVKCVCLLRWHKNVTDATMPVGQEFINSYTAHVPEKIRREVDMFRQALGGVENCVSSRQRIATSTRANSGEKSLTMFFDTAVSPGVPPGDGGAVKMTDCNY